MTPPICPCVGTYAHGINIHLFRTHMPVWSMDARETPYLLSKAVPLFTHETQVKRRAKERGELQATSRDIWRKTSVECSQFLGHTSYLRHDKYLCALQQG